jgi:hypothetical protein
LEKQSVAGRLLDEFRVRIQFSMRELREHVIVGLALVVGGWLAASLAAVQPHRADLISEAIAAGMTADVPPYQLKHVVDTTSVIGLVYTPYVRIARYARAMRLNGESVDPGRIPEAVSEDVIHVAIQQVRQSSSALGQPVRVAAIVRPPGVSPPGKSAYFVPKGRALVPALRVEEVAMAERILGAIPLDDIGAVGVFPLSFANQLMLEFCAYREYADAAGAPAYDVVAGFASGPLR